MGALPVCLHGPGTRISFKITNSRCAGYLLFLNTYLDNATNLGAAKAGFLLVILKETARPFSKPLIHKAGSDVGSKFLTDESEQDKLGMLPR